MNLRTEADHIFEKAWYESKKFNSLEIWMYNYENPVKVRTQLGLFIPITHCPGVGSTDYFLVENKLVISCGTLLRKKK